jgi:hypothetical protein
MLTLAFCCSGREASSPHTFPTRFQASPAVPAPAHRLRRVGPGCGAAGRGRVGRAGAALQRDDPVRWGVVVSGWVSPADHLAQDASLLREPTHTAPPHAPLLPSPQAASPCPRSTPGPPPRCPTCRPTHPRSRPRAAAAGPAAAAVRCATAFAARRRAACWGARSPQARPGLSGASRRLAAGSGARALDTSKAGQPCSQGSTCPRSHPAPTFVRSDNISALTLLHDSLMRLAAAGKVRRRPGDPCPAATAAPSEHGLHPPSPPTAP